MKDIYDPVSRATDLDSPLAERHEAFGELVLRFQDMAFASAYAVLGDAYLAEDVAQDAFVTAWLKLSQLRTPEAFPGWFKRIVLRQCNRLTRGKRLQVVPLEIGADNPAPDPGPHFIAEKQQLLTKVLAAIKALPENERLVTTLFYVDGYTQADIGEFLEVPVSTVNKRLYSARQRLKESVFEMFKDKLQQQRPSRNSNFSNRVNASLRPVAYRDWPLITALAASRAYDDQAGNDRWLHHRRKFDESRYFRRQYVAEEAGSKQILGYGCIEQSIYLPRYQLFLVTDPCLLRQGVGSLLLERLTNDLIEANAITVSCREYSSQTELLAFLKENGFSEVTALLDSRLPVSDTDLTRFLPVVGEVKARGITIATLAEERARDAHCIEKLYALTIALHEDDPGRGPFALPAYNAREALLWLEMSYVLPDAYFIAKQGERYVGISDVSLFEAVPGGLTQGFTGVIRECRRQGIATALKMRAIEYAQRQGYRIIQSFNHPRQTAALALNKKLGFQLLFSHITLEKCLREVVTVPGDVYDDYAGLYRDDEARPDLEIIARNEAGRLTIECIGQKVELFPVSESKFFIKQFYGETTFVRDEQGRVNLLHFEMTNSNSRSPEMIRARKIG